MGNAINIERFSTYDKEKVLDLLSGAGLPVEDLTNEKMINFMVAKGQDDCIIGVVGVEMYQETGLLRSLAVHPTYREKGIGRRLTRKIESFARHNGIKILYLLTMTAADFFQKIGYEVTQRDEVPESIKKTEEFKSVCPVSAACLFKVLDLA
ncbi:MAG: GNAT family N-acetyltransferase [Desulfobacterales bacterium]|nr:MAG: GNAT family N-acetyltransferase [Desulfobacterales bacterium]